MPPVRLFSNTIDAICDHLISHDQILGVDGSVDEKVPGISINTVSIYLLCLFLKESSLSL